MRPVPIASSRNSLKNPPAARRVPAKDYRNFWLRLAKIGATWTLSGTLALIFQNAH